MVGKTMIYKRNNGLILLKLEIFPENCPIY